MPSSIPMIARTSESPFRRLMNTVTKAPNASDEAIRLHPHLLLLFMYSRLRLIDPAFLTVSLLDLVIPYVVPFLEVIHLLFVPLFGLAAPFEEFGLETLLSSLRALLMLLSLLCGALADLCCAVVVKAANATSGLLGHWHCTGF